MTIKWTTEIEDTTLVFTVDVPANEHLIVQPAKRF